MHWFLCSFQRLQQSYARSFVRLWPLPFPLHHPDLNVANLMFDEGFNITGVIDWNGTADRLDRACIRF